jgi:hypothetical protein
MTRYVCGNEHCPVLFAAEIEAYEDFGRELWLCCALTAMEDVNTRLSDRVSFLEEACGVRTAVVVA